MVDTWSPARYLQFGDERTRPARDLLAHVPLRHARQVVDVGCGPANSTALLAERFPDARIVGLDSSPAMLAEARRALPSAAFVEGDASVWLPGPEIDLVFANAVYQWIPGHLALFPRLVAALELGGVLAVQMPDNVAEPTHRLMSEVAATSRFADTLAHAAWAPLPEARAYVEALAPVSSSVDIWVTVYHHRLSGPDAIVDWVRGTGLRPFVDALEADERDEFLTEYRRRVTETYAPLADGQVLLRYPRLFMVVQR